MFQIHHLSYFICLILLIPGIYGQYSVFKYFGINRAFGIDHFKPEKYKNRTFVKKGIFKYTPNGMYKFVFLLLWIPGILFQSKAALIAALFQHIYIWILHTLIEELSQKRIENLNIGRADLIISRALAPLYKLLSYSLLLSNKNTTCLFLKGRSVYNEIEMARKNFFFNYETFKSISSEEGHVLKITNLNTKKR